MPVSVPTPITQVVQSFIADNWEIASWTVDHRSDGPHLIVSANAVNAASGALYNLPRQEYSGEPLVRIINDAAIRYDRSAVKGYAGLYTAIKAALYTALMASGTIPASGTVT